MFLIRFSCSVTRQKSFDLPLITRRAGDQQCLEEAGCRVTVGEPLSQQRSASSLFTGFLHPRCSCNDQPGTACFGC